LPAGKSLNTSDHDIFVVVDEGFKDFIYFNRAVTALLNRIHATILWCGITICFFTFVILLILPIMIYILRRKVSQPAKDQHVIINGNDDSS